MFVNNVFQLVKPFLANCIFVKIFKIYLMRQSLEVAATQSTFISTVTSEEELAAASSRCEAGAAANAEWWLAA
jgi:hypothetical protein